MITSAGDRLGARRRSEPMVRGEVSAKDVRLAGSSPRHSPNHRPPRMTSTSDRPRRCARVSDRTMVDTFGVIAESLATVSMRIDGEHRR